MPRRRDEDPDAPLKRLGGGRWQTRDARFTIEPQSGTWVVVHGEQTDELGLPLVRGPFGSLAAAKVAIADARTGAAPASPLEPVPAAPAPEGEDTPGERRGPKRASGAAQVEPARPRPATKGAPRERPGPAAQRGPEDPGIPEEPREPEEPRWLRDLEPDDRRRARRAIGYLRDAGATDPEGIGRRDLVGDVPAIAAWAIRRALDVAGPEASPRAVAELLADGRDRDLGVRWHLVDGDGRRIQLDLEDLDGG